MGMFKNFSNEGLEESGDTLGGGFEPLSTALYDAKIKLAYVGNAASSKAMSITFHADINSKEYRETVWISNRNGENFYADKQDAQKKHPLPGYTLVDDLCMFITETPLSDQVTEEKTIKLYSFDEKKDIPTKVQVLTGLLGGEVKLGILRQIVDKQKKNPSSGAYENTGETRTENVTDKVFHPETGRTLNEYRHEIETPEFLEAWDKKNTGNDRNKAKGVAAGGNTGLAGTGKPGGLGGGSSAKTSLFGKG